jgi:hypothetical protein
VKVWQNLGKTWAKRAGRKMIFSPLDALPDLNLILSDCQNVRQSYNLLKDSPQIVACLALFVCLG